MKSLTSFFMIYTPINIGQFHPLKVMVCLSACLISLLLIQFLVAGTAFLCKMKPISVKYDFPSHSEGKEAAKGRLLVLEYPKTYLVGTYVPNAGQQLKVSLFC